VSLVSWLTVFCGVSHSGKTRAITTSGGDLPMLVECRKSKLVVDCKLVGVVLRLSFLWTYYAGSGST